MFSIASQGNRFHVLNGSHGTFANELAKFPQYSFGTGPYPSVCLDNETGDVYTYEKGHMSWIPQCNIGCYMSSLQTGPHSSRSSSSTSGRVPVKYSSREEREDMGRPPLEMSQIREIKQTHCYLRSKHIQHYALRNFPHQHFLAAPVSNWNFNHDGALPVGCNLQVLVDSDRGPVVIADGLKLMVGFDIRDKTSLTIVTQVIENFISVVVTAIGTVRSMLCVTVST